VVGVVFVTSWPLMALAEPAASPITDADIYWWWFVVTASTVGYGDHYPTTLGGHVVGGYVIIGGIATLTTLFARLAEMLENAKGRRMQGLAELDLNDHVVVLGYTTGRTERVASELLAEADGEMVLCAWADQAATHPMAAEDKVHFVRGDLVDEGVLHRACIERARAVLVDARDDNEALSVTVAVNHVNPDVHTVVALRDLERARNVSRVDESIRCVQWHQPRMLTEELQDPGIAQVYAELMTHGGGNTYSTAVPAALADATFGELQQALGRAHSATVLAARSADKLLVSPGWDTTIPAGAVVYYIASHRLADSDLTAALR